MSKISKKLRVFVLHYPSRETKFSKNCSFKGKPPFFLWTVSVKLGRKFVVSRVFWRRNLKPVVVSLKPGVSGGMGGLTPGWARGPERRPERSAPTPPKNPGFNETTTGFKFLLKKIREYRHFSSKFH